MLFCIISSFDRQINNKVLLCECKRHTASRLASPGGGGTYLGRGGTYLGRWCTYLGEGTYIGPGYLPWPEVPTLAGGVPTLAGGVPTLVRVPTLARGTYLGRRYLPWLGGTYLGRWCTYLGEGTYIGPGYLPWPEVPMTAPLPGGVESSW